MQQISIKCPRCGKGYNLKARSLQTLESRPFRCPNCDYVAPFGNLMRPSNRGPMPPQMQFNAGGPRVNKTRVSVNPGEMRLMIPGGRSIAVTAGTHIMGRDSRDSDASLKIAPDRYMSRRHARLDVTSIGVGVDCRITPLASANDVFVNNRRLLPNETEQLRNGDKILLGMTTITVMI